MINQIRHRLFETLRAIRGFVALLALAPLTHCASSPSTRTVLPQSEFEMRAAGDVLMVLTAADTQTLVDGSTRSTGYFLNEFYEPFNALVEAGYSVTIATPGGKPAALDPESLDEKYWKENPGDLKKALAFVDSHKQLKAPSRLKDVLARSDSFQAVIVPGGQGVMVDLLNNPTVLALLKDIGASDRPVGLICHAPALLSRMDPSGNPFIGRRVTSVSGIEEWYIETFVMDAKASVRGIGDRLEEAGMVHEAAFPGRANAVRDCNIVTSQNPFSGKDFNDLFLDALYDWRRGGRCEPDL